MLYELVLILCMNPGECVVDRTQMRAEQCIERAVEARMKYGRDMADPPYLRESPACVLRAINAATHDEQR